MGGQKPELLYLPTYSKYHLLSIEIQKPLTALTKPLVFTKMGENSPKIGTKGQLISKGLVGKYPKFFQKTNEKIQPTFCYLRSTCFLSIFWKN